MAKTSTPEEPRLYPTAELSRHRKLLPRLRSNSGYSFDIWVADGCEADRLLLAGKITVNQHAVLLSFMVLLHKAGMLGPKSPAFERVSSSDPVHMSNKMSVALAKVGVIHAYLDKKIGRARRNELVNICMATGPMMETTGDLAVSLAGLGEAIDRAYQVG